MATERGYEGTTISLVSKKSGLPPTSIYWHFADKDDLIAAVIERSFQRWLAALELPSGQGTRERAIELGTQVAKALLDAPEFLRLGLMLALERRPVEPRAREMFLQVRDKAFRRFRGIVRDIAPGLDEQSVRLLTTYAIAGADGLFIAKEVGGDSVDLIELLTYTPDWSSNRRSNCWGQENRHDHSITQLTDVAQLLYDAQSRGIPISTLDSDLSGSGCASSLFGAASQPCPSPRPGWGAVRPQDWAHLRADAGTPRGQ